MLLAHCALRVASEKGMKNKIFKIRCFLIPRIFSKENVSMREWNL